VRERRHWDEYMQAYEAAIRATSTEAAPWYVVPADKKWFTRLVVAAAVVEAVEVEPQYLEISSDQAKALAKAREELEGEKKAAK
jgi:hypothetical protein